MKRIFGLLLVCFIAYSSSQAQYVGIRGTNEIGLTIGASTFFGDLGGSSGIGKPFVKDLEFGLTRPIVGAFYRKNFTNHLAARIFFNYTIVSGDDSLLGSEEGTGHYPRYYRNLHFKSNIFELGVLAEVSLLPFDSGRRDNKVAPYVAAGIAMFKFNPKTRYNGEWVRLQPLGTEGQGMVQYPNRKKYKLTQFNVPLAIGIKYNLNYRWNIGIELMHRITFTDYIDDVSKTYVNPDFFDATYDTNTAALAKAVSNRTYELDPLGVYGNYSQRPEMQRGDPTDFDSYSHIGVTISYIFGYSFCPTW